MKRILQYFVINGLFAASVYYGLFQNVVGAERIAVFMVWFSFLLSFAFFTESAQKKMKELGRTVPLWIDLTFDLTIWVAFLWVGHWVTAIVYFIHILVHNAAWENALTTDETK